MTVIYAPKVANSGCFGSFWRLLFLWKGSVYKLVYAELLLWLSLYATISVCRRNFLTDEQLVTFNSFCIYCSKFAELIPLSFVLGFYVALVINRWWFMWDSLPWPDDSCMFVSAVLRGQDERARLMRRTIARYVNLAGIHTMALFSRSVRKRFPTLDHLVAAGLLEEEEKKIFEQMSGRNTKLYWLPLVWATHIVTKARREKIIEADITAKTILDHLCEYRRKCERSLHIEVINVPLVYSQVVTIAVYAFFTACLFGRQFVDERAVVDMYLPIFTTLQFVFYMGWLKVAETLINPYGDDDDDFELNWLIDRHLQVSFMIVDEMHATHPELVKDVFWDTIVPAPAAPASAPAQQKPDAAAPPSAPIPIPTPDANSNVKPVDPPPLAKYFKTPPSSLFAPKMGDFYAGSFADLQSATSLLNAGAGDGSGGGGKLRPRLGWQMSTSSATATRAGARPPAGDPPEIRVVIPSDDDGDDGCWAGSARAGRGAGAGAGVAGRRPNTPSYLRFLSSVSGSFSPAGGMYGNDGCRDRAVSGSGDPLLDHNHRRLSVSMQDCKLSVGTPTRGSGFMDRISRYLSHNGSRQCLPPPASPASISPLTTVVEGEVLHTASRVPPTAMVFDNHDSRELRQIPSDDLLIISDPTLSSSSSTVDVAAHAGNGHDADVSEDENCSLGKSTGT